MSTYRERRLERADRLREWAEKRAARSSGNFAHAHNLVKDIPLGQPILVGHHSERRHRRTLERSDAAMRRGVEDARKGADMASRAASIEDAADRAIYRDDVDAIERLQAKIAKLETERDAMKRANAIVRKRGLDTAAKVAQLAALLQCKPDTAAKLLEPDCCGRLGFAPYELSNRGGVITRERKRLAELTADRTASGAAIVAPAAETPLARAGLIVTATMTTPAKAWKKPRPVWNVSGNLAHWRPALVEQLGGSWYRGTVSFFEDPTDTIIAAIVEAEHAAQRVNSITTTDTRQQPARPTEAYRLPDGRIVPIYADVSRGADTVTFQLVGGDVVNATRYTPDVDAFTTPADLRCEICGESAGEGGALCPACMRSAGDDDDREPCDECGATVPTTGDMISAAHERSCSLHPDNVTSRKGIW